MSEVEIYAQLSNSMIATGLFAMVWAFLLWVAGRAATVTLENNGGILMKLAVTVFGFVGLYQFNLSGSFFANNFQLAGHSLAVLKESGAELSARADAMIANTGASVDVPAFSLMPNWIGILLILSLGYLIIGRLWLGHDK
jgi:hypothetical protein